MYALETLPYLTTEAVRQLLGDKTYVVFLKNIHRPPWLKTAGGSPQLSLFELLARTQVLLYYVMSPDILGVVSGIDPF